MANQKTKILIAEDDKLIVNALTVGLDRAGFEVMFAYNGKDALEKIRGDKPDVLLLDLAMPIMDGFMVLKELKANEQTKNLPVLVFTNLADDESQRKVKDFGVDEYYLKADHTIKDLVHKIKEHCNEVRKIQFYYHI
jgi:DNA-binding response OmpR family regulator